jgi:hypothetical protein
MLKNDCVWCGAINALGTRFCLQCGHVPDVPKMLCNCAQCREAEERGETPWRDGFTFPKEGLRGRDSASATDRASADNGFNSRPLPLLLMPPNEPNERHVE